MENLSQRAAWLVQARPHQIAPDEYDLWTLWGERGWGKTRALIEELLSLAEKGVMSPRGLHAPNIGIFVEDIRRAFDFMVFGRAGISALSDYPVSINTATATVIFHNGATIRFYSFKDHRRAAGIPLDHFAIDEVDKAMPHELREIYRIWQTGARWSESRMIQTCRILPPLSVSFFVQPRRHLAIGASPSENTDLPEAFLEAAKEDANRANGDMTADTYLHNEDVPRGCRWSARRKTAFLQALDRWPDDAQRLLTTYGVGAEEIAEWRRGESGIRATRVTPAALRDQ